MKKQESPGFSRGSVNRLEEHDHQAAGRLESQSFAIGRVYEAALAIRAEMASKQDIAEVRTDLAEVKSTLGKILGRLPEHRTQT